jgi:trans-aconitate methyltransferase
MTEWKLFDGAVAPFTDDEFYRDREAAHHMEQEGHRDRLLKAVDYALQAKEMFGCKRFSDLGCGDGGLVEEGSRRGLHIWGYDMQPDNVRHALKVRKVDVRLTNFEKDSEIFYGDCSILTEVLEHVSDPHGLVFNLPSDVIIASSPAWETDGSHYEFHNWAWDKEGYAALIEQGGYEIVRHEEVWLSQIILGVRR